MHSAFLEASLPVLWLLLLLRLFCLALQLLPEGQLLLPGLCHIGLHLPVGSAEECWSCVWDWHTGWSTAGSGCLHPGLQVPTVCM